MAIVFDSKFESDLSGWSSTISGTGGAIAHDTPGLAGTAGLAKFSYTANTTAAFLERTFTNTATVLRSRFYLDQSGVDLPINGRNISIWHLRGGTGDASRVAWVVIRRDDGVPRRIRLGRWDDSAVFGSTDVDISTLVPEWIEIRATKSSTDATSDATLTMYFGGGDFNPNGEQVAQLTGFLSWAKFEAADRIRIGMTPGWTDDISASVLLLDEVVLRDDDTPIGPLSGAALSAAIAAGVTAFGSLASGWPLASSVMVAMVSAASLRLGHTLAVSQAMTMTTDGTLQRGLRLAALLTHTLSPSGSLAIGQRVAAHLAAALSSSGTIASGSQVAALVAMMHEQGGHLTIGQHMAASEDMVVVQGGTLSMGQRLGTELAMAMVQDGDLLTAVELGGALALTVTVAGEMMTGRMLSAALDLSMEVDGLLVIPPATVYGVLARVTNERLLLASVTNERLLMASVEQERLTI